MNPVLSTVSVFRMIRHCCQHEPYGLVLSSVRSCLMSRAKSEKWKSARDNFRSRFHLYVYGINRDLGEYFPEHPPREAQAREVVSEIGMLRQSTLGADEATALVITDTQQAGLQPPKYAFAPRKKSRHPCRSCTSSFDISVEQQLSSERERQTNPTRKDKQNAIHGHRQSLERLR